MTREDRDNMNTAGCLYECANCGSFYSARATDRVGCCGECGGELVETTRKPDAYDPYEKIHR